jgi:aerobic-type carbon monoxide dehydrogenase small subunit (CoxS/CutS family)
MTKIQVMNQGNCGACYAFISAQAVESALAIKTGHLVPLSSQQLIDCSGLVGNHGCVGGGIARAMTYIIQNGFVKSKTILHAFLQLQSQFDCCDCA